jgi:hypothetical protein
VIGETLIKPVAKVMAKVMDGDKASNATTFVPLSNKTVHRRVADMAEKVKQHLLL